MRSVLEDFRTAPIPEAERALFAYLEKLNATPGEIRRGDVEAVRAAGWSDEDIFDAVSVCALWNFYDRWVDGTGVQDMSPEAYAASGRRLATEGYVPGNPSSKP